MAKDYGRWTPVAEEDIRSIIATSQGMPGSGKTHFWLTAPEPIAYFLFDPGGLKGLKSNPLFKGKDIRVIDYCGDLNIGKLEKSERITRSIDIMGQFQQDWDCAAKWARTFVWDKEPLVWEMLRYAHDEVDSPVPKNFHELNLMYRGWVQDAEVRSINFGLLRDMHDTWGIIGKKADGKPQYGFTGIYKPDGQKHVPGLVQLNLEHRWDDEKRTFTLKVMEKCRLGNAKTMMGKMIDDCDFMTLATMLFPHSDLSEWGLE